MRDDVAEKMWNRRTIIADIEQMIETGLWPPGTKLPTREQMREHYGARKEVIDGVVAIMIASGKLVGGRGGRVRVAGDEEGETGALPEAELAAELKSTEDSPEETDQPG